MNCKSLPRIAIDPLKAKEAVALAYRNLESRYPELDLESYAAFSKTGDRVSYEEPYFQRRNLLLSFAIAQWLQPRPEFLRRVEEGIDLLLAEPSWCLPAHNTYVRDAPALPVPDPDRPVIDLFAAETGATLAIIQTLVSLDRPLQERLETELEKRIKVPYCSTHFWWMGNGDEPMCNWSPWCTSNVLLVFLLTGGALDGRYLSDKAIYTLQCFLKDLGEDGGYPEGVEYWTHAALPLVVSLALLKEMGCEEAEKLESSAKVQSLLDFPLSMHAGGPWYLNWGDCSAKAKVGDVRILWSGRFFPCEENLTTDGAHDGLIRYLSLGTYQRHSETQPPFPYYHYPSLGLSVWHKEGWDLGVRAGSNGFSHQHNDLGSLILYRNGRPWLVDAGVETYTGKTFSPERYTIWTMRSPWHNTVNPQGGEQKSDGKAQVTRSDVRGFEGIFDEAYPQGWKWRRAFSIDRKISVKDTCPQDSVLTLISQTKPEIEGRRIRYPGLGVIRFLEPVAAILEEIPVTDTRLRLAWEGNLWRLLVTGGPFSWVIEPTDGR